MKVCQKCKTENEDKVRFCYACGTEFKSDTDETSNLYIKEPSNDKSCDENEAIITENKPMESMQDNDVSHDNQNQKSISLVKEEKSINIDIEDKKKGETKAEKPKGRKKSSKLPIILGCAAAIAAVVCLCIFVFSGKPSEDKTYGMYLKEGELFYTDYTEEGAIQLTSKLINDDLEDYLLDSYDSWYKYSDMGDDVSLTVMFSADGKRVFFPDRLEGESAYDGEGVAIYYRNLKKPNEEAVKVDSDIINYAINDEGTSIVYIKISGGVKSLYVSDLEDSEKIAKDVCRFDVADNCKKIGYTTEDNNYYIWTEEDGSKKVAGDMNEYGLMEVYDDLSVVYYQKNDALYRWTEESDSEKLLTDVQEISYHNDDFSIIYYISEAGLHKWTSKENKSEEIDSEIDKFICAYESGEVYYLKKDYAEKTCMDYINDDFAIQDADIEEPDEPEYPEYPEYPYWIDYDSDFEYEMAMEEYENEWARINEERNNIHSEYEIAYDEYMYKEQRDDARELFEDEEIYGERYALYCYDGEDTSMIIDGITSIFIDRCDTKPILSMEVCNDDEVEKIDLSEILDSDSDYDTIYDVQEAIQYAINEALYNVIVIGKNTEIIEEDVDQILISGDGKNIYYLADISNVHGDDMPEEAYNYDGCGDLYKADISSGKMDKKEVYDSDVSTVNIYFNDNQDIVYYKNYNKDSNTGDLYVNGEELLTDAYLYSVVLSPTSSNKDINFVNGDIYYFTDMDEEKDMGTLYRYHDGKDIKISDDVYDYRLIGNEEIVYLYDYSTKHGTGTLYKYEKDDPVKLDDDVNAFADRGLGTYSVAYIPFS